MYTIIVMFQSNDLFSLNQWCVADYVVWLSYWYELSYAIWLSCW